MKAFSMDLRERVVRAYEGNEGTMEEIAKRFEVSRVWVKKMVHQKRKTGSLAPIGTKRGPKPIIAGDDLKRLEEAVEKQPDATLEQLRDMIRVECTIVTIHNTLKRAGFRRLKKR